MMLANVDGRPMPFSSSALTRLASVKRGFGAGRVALRLDLLQRQHVADREHRQRLVVGLVGVAALLVVALFVRLEESLERVDGAGCRELRTLAAPSTGASTASVTVVVSYFASDIWLAIVRFQIRSYMRCSSRSSSPATDDGVRNCLARRADRLVRLLRVLAVVARRRGG